jgi:hypothetical protein
MDSSALLSAEYWLSWIGAAKLIAALLVAVGVVVEFGTDWTARPYEKVVKDEKERELAALQLDVANANKRAAEANAAAAALAKEAAQLKIDLEAERNKRASRTVSDEQLSVLTTELAKIGGPIGLLDATRMSLDNTLIDLSKL